MTNKVQNAINDFVNKKETNRKGVSFDAVVSKDRQFVQDLLTKFYDAYKLFFKDEVVAEENFCKKLATLTAIRFDTTDESLEPLSEVYADMRNKNNGNLTGGVCYVGDGYNAILDADMMTLSKDEAIHTAIHEIIHLMTIVFMLNKQNNVINKIGLTAHDHKDAIARFINEGFTEKLAQMMWDRMYPNVKCPGIGRYDLNVQTINAILDQLGNEEEIIEKYFIDATEVIEIMKNQVDNNNKDMWEFVHDFQGKDIGNINVKTQFLTDIKNFNYSNVTNIQP